MHLGFLLSSYISTWSLGESNRGMKKMKKIALLLVVFSFFHLLPTELAITTSGYVRVQPKEETGEKLSAHMGLSNHIGGGGGGRAGGGGRGGSFGGGRSRGGQGAGFIPAAYLGAGAQSHNNHKHSAAASNHQSIGVGLNAFTVIFLALSLLIRF